MAVTSLQTVLILTVRTIAGATWATIGQAIIVQVAVLLVYSKNYICVML